jgi:hypothetical protein
MAFMHPQLERSSFGGTKQYGRYRPRDGICERRFAEAIAPIRFHCSMRRDKASPGRAVMLHLRARYVSKAAIFTIPASLLPVENRSPA